MRASSTESKPLASRTERYTAGGFKLAVFVAVTMLVLGSIWQQEIESRDAQAKLTVEPLSIETAKGSFVFQVEIANTGETIRRGLAQRETLGDREGMLFHWAKRHRFRDEPAPARVTMRRTVLALDIIFLDAAGRVQSIEQGVPQSIETIRSVGPTVAFLEIAAGVADELGITIGDRIKHSMFAMVESP